MNIRIDWRSTIAAAAILTALAVFPLVNPCTEELLVCSTESATNFYGLTLWR